MIDFNSLSQDGGPHGEAGFQYYEAGHEVPEDFDTKEYSAFGSTISLTPTWPDTTDNRVMQSIDRGATHDASWLDVSDPAAGTYGLDLITDFLGIDTRTGNGGNGDWWPVMPFPGEVPTTMLLTLGGLPAGEYDWTSFHHDTEHVHGNFEVQLSTDGGATYTKLDNGIMSDGSAGGNPDSESNADFGPGSLVTTTAELDAAGGIYRTSFTADGTNDVVFQWQPYALEAVHNQIFGINGFILENDSIIVNPGVACDADADMDCDLDDLATMYAGAGAAGAFDFDGNGTIGNEDLAGWLAAASMSSNTANPDGRTYVLGDVNLDFKVDSSDLGLLLNNFNSTAASPGAGAGYGGGDINMNGSVDSSDLGLLLNNFGTANASAAAVPEPSSVALLMLAALSALGLRRRS